MFQATSESSFGPKFCSMWQDKGLLGPNSQRAPIDFSGTAELLTSHSIDILISCSIKKKKKPRKSLCSKMIFFLL